MAEFENGYCTGCGVKVRRWGHRPYCWRQVSMGLDVNPTWKLKAWCLSHMEKHWRIRSLFLVRKEHMYCPSAAWCEEQMAQEQKARSLRVFQPDTFMGKV